MRFYVPKIHYVSVLQEVCKEEGYFVLWNQSRQCKSVYLYAEPSRLAIENPHLLSTAWNLAHVLLDNWRIYDWSDQKFTLNIPSKSH